MTLFPGTSGDARSRPAAEAVNAPDRRRRITPEHNLAVLRPDLAAEWHAVRNGDLAPGDVAPQSDRRVWWRCGHGHEWEARIQSRTRGTGCPYCAGKRASKDRNLAALHPDLAGEWHRERNGDLTPADVVPGSGKPVWWRCHAGHEWAAPVTRRTRGAGCPFCSGQRPTAQRNLSVLHPELAAEWHPDRNGELSPADVTPGTGRRVWWRCALGHEWNARIMDRARRSQRCPYCAGRRPTPEHNLAVVRPDLAAEWHPERNGKLSPMDLLPKSNRRVWWRCSKGHVWLTAVVNRAQGTGCPVCADYGPKGVPLAERAPDLLDEWDVRLNGGRGDDVLAGSHLQAWWRCRIERSHLWRAEVVARVRGTGCPYCAGKLPTLERNLAALRPDLVAEWHPERNGDLSPADILPKSNRTVWWQCRSGHEWAVAPVDRSSSGCPFCQGRLPTPERNLAVLHPAIAAQWHPDRNGGLLPTEVTPRTDMRAWWRCHAGHEWNTAIDDRTCRNAGCPYCAGNLPTPEHNLAALRPDLAEEWHPDRNGDLRPDQVAPLAHIPIWWRCSAGHEWRTKVAHRATAGCPYCAGRLPTAERNLACLHPALAAEWHPVRNGELAPDAVAPGARRRVWWRCSNGHEWLARIGSRVRGNGCPHCAGRKAAAGPDAGERPIIVKSSA